MKALRGYHWGALIAFSMLVIVQIPQHDWVSVGGYCVAEIWVLLAASWERAAEASNRELMEEKR